MELIVLESIENADIQWKLTSTRLEEWIENDVLGFKWWLLLGVFVLSAYAWWKTVDKSRLTEIVVYMGITCITVLMLDELGEELTLWDYPIEIIPLFPPIASIDLASLPLVYSLIYQHFKDWKSFLIASFLFSALSCFVLEPLFVVTGIYQMITWKSYFGLPLYFAIAVFGKAMIGWIFSIESKHKT